MMHAELPLFLVGEQEILGLWNPEKASPLVNDPVGSSQWVGTLKMNSSFLNFKFIQVDLKQYNQ